MAQQPRLLDQVRQRIRTRNYSIRTEKSYIDWIRRFILFHDKRHPREMGIVEVEQFLTNLAVERNVAASTQNQALSAILFLYKEVLEVDCRGWTTWCGRNGLNGCLWCSPVTKSARYWRIWKARIG